MYQMNKWESVLHEALLSGKYIQGPRKLKKIVDNQLQHCCLGVICDIIDPSSWRYRIGYNNEPYFEIEDESGILPNQIRDMLDWYDGTGLLDFMDREGCLMSLVHMNDYGFTFSQIADVIKSGRVVRAGEIEREEEDI